jgi:hypothetical protein
MSSHDEEVFVAGTEDGITAELESTGVISSFSSYTHTEKNSHKNQSANDKQMEEII